MPKSPNEKLNAFGFRLPDVLVQRIDAYARRVEAQSGHRVSRSDAIRVLLLRALDAEGITAAPKPKGGKR